MAAAMSTDPFSLFDSWLAEAEASEPNDPNAMALATVNGEGQPAVRMVLLKGHGRDGFVFYTNLDSRKGDDLRTQGKAALLFHWKTLRRQIRIEGPVSPVSDAEADTYFATRPRDSQIGAWASEQSRPLSGRAAFLARIATEGARFLGRDVPRPPHWSGFRVAPQRMEFWEDREYRLHERTLYLPDGAGGWAAQMLFP
jgi:pyridoxamine 5'-phosphate oxidase